MCHQLCSYSILLCTYSSCRRRLNVNYCDITEESGVFHDFVIVKDGEMHHFTTLNGKSEIQASRVLKSSHPPASDYDGPLASKTRIPTEESNSVGHDSGTEILEIPKSIYFHTIPSTESDFPFTFHTHEPPGAEVARLSLNILDIIRGLRAKLYLISLIPTQFGAPFAMKVTAHVAVVPEQHIVFAEKNFLRLDERKNNIFRIENDKGMKILVLYYRYRNVLKRFDLICSGQNCDII